MRRIALPIGVIVAWSLAVASSSTSLQGPISIHTAGPSSHLRLRVQGSELLVEGRLSSRTSGCRLGRGGARCNLSDAPFVLIETGSGPDKVEVLDPLPVPLTVHLGSGSDKLIGNAEPDTCYPEGTPRNRCIGGGGDDVCESGPVNTDCLGGPGNDFCRTGAGSDGCWGGPGRDVCLMGRGEDGCHGGPGRDRLYGGPDPDQLYGGPGHDYCDGGPGVGRSHSCEAGPRH
ncbi:MAG TPA: calcium-binding protein [Solirubrobacterales bacterium]